MWTQGRNPWIWGLLVCHDHERERKRETIGRNLLYPTSQWFINLSATCTAYWILHEWVFAQKKPPKNNKTNNKNNLVLQHEDAHALNKLCSLFSDCGSDDLYSDSEEDEASNFEPVRWGFFFNMSCQLHVSLVLCGALHTSLPMSSRGVLRDKSSRNIEIKPRALWPLPRKFQLLERAWSHKRIFRLTF